MVTEKPLAVLHVEDSPAYTIWIAETLGSYAEVKATGTLSEAVNRDGFEIALLDLTLPDSSGAETVARFREAHPDIPVVALSGDESPETRKACLEAGADAFYAKSQLETDLLVASMAAAVNARRNVLSSIQRINAESILSKLSELEAAINDI